MVLELLDLDRLMVVSSEYWLQPRLPDENVMFADVHWEVIKRIIPAYDRFVNLSTNINRTLSTDFDVSIHHTLPLSARLLTCPMLTTHQSLSYAPMFFFYHFCWEILLPVLELRRSFTSHRFLIKIFYL